MKSVSVRHSLVLAVALAFVSCNKSSSGGETITIPPPPDPDVTIIINPPPPPPPPLIWSNPTNFANQGAAGAHYTPRVSVGPSGNAIAVWEQIIEVVQVFPLVTDRFLWACRYDVTTGWGDAEQLDTGNNWSLDPEVAMDDQGNALVVYAFIDSPAGPMQIGSLRFNAQSGWGNPQVVNTGSLDIAGRPLVALDGAGNGMAIWTESYELSDGTDRAHIWANSFDSESGWGTPAVIGTTTAISRLPGIAMNAGGEAMVVWLERNAGIVEDVWAAHFFGGYWQPPQLIEESGGFTSGDFANTVNVGPKVGIDDDGNAIAIWVQSDVAGGVSATTPTSIMANRFDAVTGWGTAFALESDDSVARLPAIGMGAGGEAVVTWRTSDPWQVFANRFDGTEWSGAEFVGIGYRPKAAVSATGRAVIVCLDEIGEMWSRQYHEVEGWESTEEIAPATCAYQSLHMNADGVATVVWQEIVGSGFSIWACRGE